MEENNQNTTENKKFNVPKNNGNFKEKGKVSFGKGVLIPFCSGVIGAALVVGTIEVVIYNFFGSLDD